MSRLMYYAMYGLINKGADQTTDAQAGLHLCCLHTLQSGPCSKAQFKYSLTECNRTIVDLLFTCRDKNMVEVATCRDKNMVEVATC